MSATSQEERAYYALKHMISDGTLTPGSRLIERDLSHELKMSRTPVRAAIRRLAQDGLVEILSGRGARVAQRTFERGYQVLVVREALDGIAARLAAENRSALNMRETLRQHMDRMWDAVARLDAFDYSEASSDFHRSIVMFAENAVLSETLARLEVQVVRFHFSTYLSPERLRRSIEEHELIFSAIIDHDPDRAEAEARKHVALVREHTRRVNERLSRQFSLSHPHTDHTGI